MNLAHRWKWTVQNLGSYPACGSPRRNIHRLLFSLLIRKPTYPTKNGGKMRYKKCRSRHWYLKAWGELVMGTHLPRKDTAVQNECTFFCFVASHMDEWGWIEGMALEMAGKKESGKPRRGRKGKMKDWHPQVTLHITTEINWSPKINDIGELDSSEKVSDFDLGLEVCGYLGDWVQATLTNVSNRKTMKVKLSTNIPSPHGKFFVVCSGRRWSSDPMFPTG